MRKIKTLALALIVGSCCLSALPCTAEEEMRAAIDFGSGAVKIQVAVVDTAINQIVDRPLLSEVVRLNLTEDVAAHNGSISKQMQKRAVAILREFKEKATEVAGDRPVQFAGIATAVFRRADNGAALLAQFNQELGIPFRILSQSAEGQIGFLTAKALNPQILADDLIAWDSGNGSFQMTTKQGDDQQVFEGPLGHGSVRVLLAKEVRRCALLGDDQSGNPLFEREATVLREQIKAHLPPVPNWLLTKLASGNTQIATFGDGESIFALTAAALSETGRPVHQATVTLDDVHAVITTYLAASDEAFDGAGLHRRTLTSAVFLASVMEHCGINTIHYQRSPGSTAGMLITPSLWATQPIAANDSL